MHPWTGVGFGEFNFAWTLTPFPRPPDRLLRPHPQPAAAVAGRTRHAARRCWCWRCCCGRCGARWRARAPRAADAGAGRGAAAAPRVHDGADDRACTACSSTRSGTRTSCCRRRSRSGSCLAAPARPSPRPRAGAAATRARCWSARVGADAVGGVLVGGRLHARRRDLRAGRQARRRWRSASPTAAQRVLRAPCRLRRRHHRRRTRPTRCRRSWRAPHYLLDARLMMAWATALDAGRRHRARALPRAAPARVPQRPVGRVLRAVRRRRPSRAARCRSSAWSRRGSSGSRISGEARAAAEVYSYQLRIDRQRVAP